MLSLPIDDMVQWAWSRGYWPSWQSPDPAERLLGATVFFLEAAGRPFPAVHEAQVGPLLEAIGPWPLQTWLEKLAHYSFWVTTYQRLPMFDGDENEMQWAAWAELEQSIARQSPTRRHEIEIRAPFLLDPNLSPAVVALAEQATARAAALENERLEKKWRGRLDNYVDWTAAHGRRPRASGNDPEEAKLARWYGDQRPGSLTRERAHLLDMYVPLRSREPRRFAAADS